jgi:hypothetical protein
MSLPAELVTYIFQAFPNASTLLQDIVSKYAGEIVRYAGFGFTALWEYIYDRLAERDRETIAITAASEKTAEVSEPSRQSGPPRNGYSDADKKILEQILENAVKEEPKGQLHQYLKKRTFEDAREDFNKLSGDKEEKEPTVWVKKLPHGKVVTVRETILRV